MEKTAKTALVEALGHVYATAYASSVATYTQGKEEPGERACKNFLSIVASADLNEILGEK